MNKILWIFQQDCVQKASLEPNEATVQLLLQNSDKLYLLFFSKTVDAYFSLYRKL